MEKCIWCGKTGDLAFGVCGWCRKAVRSQIKLKSYAKYRPPRRKRGYAKIGH